LPTTPELTTGRDAGNLRFHDFAPPMESFRAAVLEGLSRAEKAIPCRFLYDARGSRLFDLICEQPEYYPTLAETRILERHGDDIAAWIGPDAQLIELGSGSSVKVELLLDAMAAPAGYMPIDISREHLWTAAARIAARRPGLAVHAVCADYAQAFDLPRIPGRRVAFFPGSTIGNFDPTEARNFLALWRERLGAGGAMIVGVDLKKDPALINRAYNDAAGVTAAFSLNLLARANRELGAEFRLDGFAHHAHYDPAEGRVEIHLVSRRAQSVTIGDRIVRFAAGERLHIENSYKYDAEAFAALAEEAGFAWRTVWFDPDRLFSVHFLSVASDRVGTH
jgi:dimethylhistidine N-methyltransferase